MSADLSIHVFEGIEESDIRAVHSNTLGSKYFSGFFAPQVSSDKWTEAIKKIGKTPSCWVGSVSWLKANVMEDGDKYVPDSVNEVSEIIGEDLPEITDALIARVREAMNLPNTTDYRIAKCKDVVKFLEEHKGKKAFTMSW